MEATGAWRIAPASRRSSALRSAFEALEAIGLEHDAAFVKLTPRTGGSGTQPSDSARVFATIRDILK
jgi:hypothetical protein